MLFCILKIYKENQFGQKQRSNLLSNLLLMSGAMRLENSAVRCF